MPKPTPALPRRSTLILAALIAISLYAGAATLARAASGPNYGSIGQYGEVWRGGGFDTCWWDNATYDGKGFANSLTGCTANLTAPTPGKFVDPVGFAVDTHDPSPGGSGTAVYVLDRTSNLTANVPNYNTTGVTTWRLQKLSPTGTVLGTDEFSLPADTNNYEVSQLTVDPNTGTVYAMLAATFTPGGNTLTGLDEILNWSTAPNGSAQLVAKSSKLDTLSKGINGFKTPGVTSTKSQLVNVIAGSPNVQQPTSMALDVTGGTDYLAVQSLDDSSSGTGMSGIAQIKASTGAITYQWSSDKLNGLPNDFNETTFGPGGISTAADGSLTVMLDQSTGGGLVGVHDDMDVVSVPADLKSTPTILSSGANEVQNPDNTTFAVDSTSIATTDAPPYVGNPDGATAGALLPAPQIIPLSNGLYAGEFEPDPSGANDPQNPNNGPGLWTHHNDGIRLLSVESDHTLSNAQQPLTSLFDTLGNPTANTGGVTAAATACTMNDAATQAAPNDVGPYPAFAAGSGGTIWVLTRGIDSSGAGAFGDDPMSSWGTARQLIELSPGGAGKSCPVPSGTFQLGKQGGTMQSAGSPTSLQVPVGTTVTFDASTINYVGGAIQAYEWNFGDGNSTTVLGSPSNPFTWPSPMTTEKYTAPGTFTVTLKLIGDFGQYDETTKVIVGSGTPPVASFMFAPPNPSVGQTVTFDGSASTPSPGATITAYQWNFGDGATDTTTVPTDSHAYNAASAGYTATLTILDSSGAHSATVSMSVPVTPGGGTTTTTTTTTTSPTTTTTTTSSPPSNAFTVSGVSAHGSSIVVGVSLPDAGTVEVKGAFKITVSKKVKHGKKTKTVKTTKVITFADVTQSMSGGVGSVTLAPSGAAVSALKGISKHSSVKVGLIIGFTPNGGTLNAQAGNATVNGLQNPPKKKHHK